MKHMIKRMFATLMLAMLVLPLSAQINRTIDTKVADLLVQMPADNLTYRNKLMSDMMNLGETLRYKICQQIIEPGTGDDTKARFAVESYSKFVSTNQFGTQKAEWEKLILKIIANGQTKEVKAFFIRQLEFVGSDECLPVLNNCLGDAYLISPAVKSMLLSDKSKSAAYFAKALKGASPLAQVELVKGLGASEETMYAADIAALYGAADTELKKTVLNALARMPGEISEKLLTEEAGKADYNPNAAGATFALLRYCETIASGQAAKAAKLAGIINKKSTAVQIRINAMLIKSRVADAVQRDKVLLTALKDKDKTYRGAAVEEAVRVKSPLAPWLKLLRKSKSAQVQKEILYLLARSGDKQITDAVIPFLSSKHETVRAEALLTYALLAKEKGLGTVLNFINMNTAASDLKAAEKALLLVLDKDNIRKSFDSYEKMGAQGKTVLLNVWGVKRWNAAFENMLKASASEGQLRESAFRNLAGVSRADNLDALLQRFNGLNKEQEIELTAKAIIGAVKAAESKVAQEKKVAEAAKAGEPRRYIPIYSAIGGEKSVNAVYEQYINGKSAVALKALTTWGDHHASSALYALCKKNGISAGDRSKAFEGYVNLIAASSLPHDRKLLLMRKIMPLAVDEAEKNMVIKALANVKTFLSFKFVSTYPDVTGVQNEAANSLAKIAMPDPGKANGLSGLIVKDGLTRCKALVTGPDSQYLKIDIENYLKDLSDEKGYVAMFNGHNLDGWQGFVDNPIKKKKLSSYRLKQLQKEANVKMTECWSVKDGTITFNGKGNNLCSVKEYGDFEMIVDWRITKKGDSGVYLRGTPQVQVWDTTRVEVGAQVGSGGLYNNKKHAAIPLLVADNPIGDWNTFYIKMVGERVTVYLNGLLVVDNVVMENYWDRASPIFAKGPIELQAHGTDLAFRDVYVHELNSSELNLTATEKAEGFKALFNGVDLTGWVGNKTGYKVSNGEIVVQPKNGGHGNLFTDKEYADFNYRFEFKLTPGANNGLGIRAPLKGDAAYEGMELQVLDNTAAVYADLKPYQYHGSVYGVISAKRGMLKPVGEWNSEEVIVKGTRVKVILNGEVIVDGDIAEASKDGTLDGKVHRGLKRTKGHIGFLGHGSVVYFRNIRIKEL